jgi:Zn-dependent M16 (insulinase) family peptidase
MDHPPLPKLESQTVDLEFPDEDDSTGKVAMGWRGPHFTDIVTRTALEVLFVYLAESAISPLQQEFVECEDPVCSDVDFNTIENLFGVITLEFENVASEKIDSVRGNLLKVLSNTEIELSRMQTVIEKEILSIYDQAETNPHNSAALPLISFVLYGSDTMEDLQSSYADIQILNKLKHWSSKDWKELIEKWLLLAPYVCVNGRASPSYAVKMEVEEKARLEEQVKVMGEIGLQEAAKTLEEALAKNAIQIPDHIISSVTIPSTEKLCMHRVEHASASYSTRFHYCIILM